MAEKDDDTATPTASAGPSPEPAAPASAPAPATAPSPEPAAPHREPDPDPLGPAIRAIERGDHAEARRLARALVDDAATEPGLRKRAEAVVDQLRPDPVIVAVLATTGVLIAILAALYLGAR